MTESDGGGDEAADEDLPSGESKLQLWAVGTGVSLSGPGRPESHARIAIACFLVVAGVGAPLTIITTGESLWLALTFWVVCWTSAVVLWRRPKE